MRNLTLLVGLALLAGLGAAVAPELLSNGPSSGLDASGALANGHLLTAAGVVFLGGMLTALTPCVYPLIPITVAVFSGRNAKDRSRGRSAVLTSSYVLGMAAMFCSLGVFAALAGKAFGSMLSSPWVVVALALFFVAMAASMFGAFDVAIPSGLAQRLNQVGGAGLGGAFGMGLVAGVIAAPCTGPVLASLLTYVAKSRDIPLGAGLLFLYALGIGVPFFLIGVFSLSFGKSGPWMDAVKSLFGIALLALAIGYLRDAFPALHRLIPSGSAFVYVSAGAVALGILLGAVHKSFHGPPLEKALKAAGVALVVLGIGVRFGNEGTAFAGNAPGFPWVRDLPAGLAQARADQKPVFIDFYADWCAACKELDRKTYPTSEVREAAKKFVAIKVDGTVSSDDLDKTYDQYKVEGLPTVVFIDRQGKMLEHPRVVGFVPPAQMASLLNCLSQEGGKELLCAAK
jgi:thioredoxin:protein disulfide reductase